MRSTVHSASPRDRHGFARGTTSLLWRLWLLSYFSPVRHGWSRRAMVTASLLSKRRGHSR